MQLVDPDFLLLGKLNGLKELSVSEGGLHVFQAPQENFAGLKVVSDRLVDPSEQELQGLLF